MYIYIYIYTTICICICICIYVYACVCMRCDTPYHSNAWKFKVLSFHGSLQIKGNWTVVEGWQSTDSGFLVAGWPQYW